MSEHTHAPQPPQQPRVEADPSITLDYYLQKLAIQTKETAETWSAMQVLGREKVALEKALVEARVEVQALTAELEQATGERDQYHAQLRRLQSPPDEQAEDRVHPG